MGPLLFIIYFNDVSFSRIFFKFIVYADDTTLFANFSILNKNKLNKELAEISTWLKVNKLSLNSAKSKFLIVRKPQKQIKLPIVKINGLQIECVDNFNFLEVIVDKILLGKNKVSNKIVRIISIMNKLKCTLAQNILQFSNNTTYYLLRSSENNRVSKLQKRAVRIIRKESRLCHTDPIFKELNLLKINDIYRLQLLKCYFKYEHNSLPK